MLAPLRESSLGSTLRKFQVTAHLEKMATRAHGKVENGPLGRWKKQQRETGLKLPGLNSTLPWLPCPQARRLSEEYWGRLGREAQPRLEVSYCPISQEQARYKLNTPCPQSKATFLIAHVCCVHMCTSV